jgi:succinate dehydrogenase / fumarate reductase cytochrome b subunit
VLSAALVPLVGWLLAAAAGPEAFATANAILASVPGQLMLAAVSFAFYYHLCNGIRHSCGMPAVARYPEVYASGWSVVAAAIVLTVLTWAAVWGLLGGAS